MADVIIGIDLGTTNSEVSIVRDGVPFVIPGEDGDPILPSMVGLSEQGKLLVGKPARNQYPLFPDRTIKSIKRKMGTTEKVTLGDKEYTPSEISAIILRALKERAERELGHTVSQAVITVPAYFNDTQRQATIEAGRLAGLEVKRIINEPTAAALVYDPNQSSGTNVLVYDLGGGTFDVSIVRWEQGIVEVLASHGDTKLGGDDFDELLLNHVADQFQSEHGIDIRTERSTRARLLRACENAKKQLSDLAYATVEEEFIAEKDGIPLHLMLEVSRQQYEELIQPLIARTMECVQRSLTDSKLPISQIDRVVLVGGSTRTPIIASLLERMIGRPPRRDINPDLCVAMGASVQGAMIAGINIGTVLIDITPHTLGIKTLDPDFMEEDRCLFSPIIRRGTPLPVSRSECYLTVMDAQKEVQIEIYQGESERLELNHPIGMFMISGLSKAPAGNQIVVQFDLTLDGILKVSAKEKITGLTAHIVISNALKSLTTEERLESRNHLDELWDERDDDDDIDDGDFEDANDADMPVRTGLEHAATPSSEPMPMLDVGPREGQRESVQAKALLEKADRLRTKATSEDQAELDRLMQAVRIAIEDRRWANLEQASNNLADVLFYLED